MATNIVGPRIRKLRREKGLTQEMLAARIGVLGWDVSRDVLARVEAQMRCVTDAELLYFADALDVRVDALFPLRTKPGRRRN